ncbi:uncharacterized protein BO97DRAFT_478340 [Aspergillus homomorphus CBS 101889]|uniref:Uncharacterized protein n=1 Tax=Aspergillus homomorphus (strain CBS 101889) TaxID=1450537 RepID=A0A395HUJ7_ASPHC|nr:hypothetical protein BO97DRAFT_478340 [Aspergillus homomorphus CBS 101889]RAL11591.1 hypothetical protein BO97DRAFT_478340 [Aspergillus homomorphus CBS 101889]
MIVTTLLRHLYGRSLDWKITDGASLKQTSSPSIHRMILQKSDVQMGSRPLSITIGFPATAGMKRRPFPSGTILGTTMDMVILQEIADPHRQSRSPKRVPSPRLEITKSHGQMNTGIEHVRSKVRRLNSSGGSQTFSDGPTTANAVPFGRTTPLKVHYYTPRVASANLKHSHGKYLPRSSSVNPEKLYANLGLLIHHWKTGANKADVRYQTSPQTDHFEEAWTYSSTPNDLGSKNLLYCGNQAGLQASSSLVPQVQRSLAWADMTALSNLVV